MSVNGGNGIGSKITLPMVAQAIVLGAALVAGWVAMSARVTKMEERFAEVQADIKAAEIILQAHSDRIAYIRGVMLGVIPENGYGPDETRHGGRRD